MSLYAAYAGNLDARLMTRRAPHSPLRATGWLNGWRLTFGGEHMGWEGALATLVEDPISQVFVSLYDIAPMDEDSWTAGRAWAWTSTAAPGSASTPSTARRVPGPTS